MGTIKFEIDLPEFEKELGINITIHRDGEVVYNTTSSPSMGSINSEDLKKNTKKNNDSPKLISQDKPLNRIVDDSMASFGMSGEENKLTKESKPKTKSTTKKVSGNFMDLDL